MRLIDADRRWEETECEDNGYKLEYYQGIFALYNQNGACICEFMPNLPTAYDIDKVVEELEKAKTISVDIGFGTVINTIRKDVVLEIVKQGSVSDDVCEWKKSEEYPFDWIVGCDGCEVTHRQGDYCPRCGKKIKVVG